MKSSIVALVCALQIASLTFQSIQAWAVSECNDIYLMVTPLTAAIINAVTFILFIASHLSTNRKLQQTLQGLNMLLWLSNAVVSSIAWGQSIHYNVTCNTLPKSINVQLYSVLATSLFIASLFVIYLVGKRYNYESLPAETSYRSRRRRVNTMY